MESNSKITINLKANRATNIRSKGNYYSIRAVDGRCHVVNQAGNKVLFGITDSEAKRELQELNDLVSTSEIEDLLKSK